MATTFKLGSIQVKITKSALTITTARAAKAASRAKGRLARRIRDLQRSLNNARMERQEAQDSVMRAAAENRELVGALDEAQQQIDLLASKLRPAVNGTATRKVKQSRNPDITAARVETLHRVID